MPLVTKPFSNIITFTRASTGTFTGSNGLIQSATTNTPRFDYDPVTLAAKGLLIEEQRTNLLTYSEQFDQGVWLKINASVTANTVVAPDGTLTGDKIVPDSGATGSFYRSTGITSAQTITLSLYAKAAEWRYMRLQLGASFSPQPAAFFDLQDGVVVSQVGTGAKILPVGNGWYRLSVTSTWVSATDASAYFNPTNAPSSYTTGDGYSGIYIWGAQLEAGAFPTSYIPTVASQVTRSADVALVNTLSPWYNATEGSIVYEYVRAAGTSGGGGRVFASGVGGSNSYGIWVNQATSAQDAITIRDISGDAVSGVLFSVNSTGVNKGAVAYKVNDFAWASNGGAAATDTSGAVPSLSDQLRLGRAINTDGSYLNGHLRRITYYPRRLSNAELQAITA